MIEEIISLTAIKARTIDYVCLKLGLSEKQLRAEAKTAAKEGYQVRVLDGYVSCRAKIGPLKTVTVGDTKSGRKRVAQFTDLHFGSTHCAEDMLLEDLHRAWDLGCRQIACTGDVLDGQDAKLVEDQIATRTGGQIKRAVTLVKKAPPFEWTVIDGNHDGYNSKASGLVSGEVLETRMREAGIKWNFLGQCLGYATIHGAHWELWHPHGGASKRNSLRIILNSRAETTDKPVHVIAMGHFHKYVTVWTYPERIFGICGAGYQKKKSEFANRISSPWDVGFQVVSYELTAKKLCGEFAGEFFPSRGSI